MPERDDNAVASLDVVPDDPSIRHILYLFLPLLVPTYLECVFANGEVRDFGRSDIVLLSHLIVKEGLPYIADVGRRSENRHETGVVHINLLHLSEITHTGGVVSQKSNHTRAFKIYKIIGHIVLYCAIVCSTGTKVRKITQ